MFQGYFYSWTDIDTVIMALNITNLENDIGIVMTLS